MDANRRSRYGWMGLGALVCLFAVGLAIKARDGNRAHAGPPAEGPMLPDPKIVVEKLAAPPSDLPPLGDPVALPAPGDRTPPPPLAGLPLPGITPVAAEVPAPPLPIPPPGSETRPILIPSTTPLPSIPDVPPPVPAPVSAIDPPPPAPVPMVVVPPSVTPVSAVTPPPAPQVARFAYRVKAPGLTFRTLARQTLGSVERWPDIARLNPAYAAEAVFVVGTTLNLPGDAVLSDDEGLTPLPHLRARPPARPKAVLPLTGTFPVGMDGRTVVLPKAVTDQLNNCDTVLVSPGSARCLWITNQAHLDRLGVKLDKSPAKEVDVQAFKRLYYAQITKLPVRDGKFTLTERLAAFAGLGSEVILVGIDDHFEVWDAAAWRKFTAARKYVPVTD